MVSTLFQNEIKSLKEGAEMVAHSLPSSVLFLVFYPFPAMFLYPFIFDSFLNQQ